MKESKFDQLNQTSNRNNAEGLESNFSMSPPELNFGQTNNAPAQLQEEEEEMQMKANPAQLQEEEEEMQMKDNPNADISNTSHSSGSSAKIPEGVKSKMESTLGADFSDVNVHKDSEKASNVGALAYAQGNDVHFAPGKYNPETNSGQQLLGHELTHVVQQRQGRVQTTMQKKGVNINNDPSLEREADQLGAKAANKKEE